MTGKKITKNEGPSCACGKVDLYEEWLKQNENKGDEIAVSTIEEEKTLKKQTDATENEGNN